MTLEAPTDPPLAALLARFRQGDTEALAAIFDATGPGLFRSALHLAPDAGAAAKAEEIERVHRALDELPETYREVAILRWRYGMEPAAIAHARGVAPGTVRSL